MPMTRIRSPCATNSGGFGYFISTSLDAFLSTAANSACPRYLPASGQPSPGMIHSISSAARSEFGGLWVFHFHLFGRLLKHSRQFRVPAVPAGQRPALAWNDPLNIFGSQIGIRGALGISFPPLWTPS